MFFRCSLQAIMSKAIIGEFYLRFLFIYLFLGHVCTLCVVTVNVCKVGDNLCLCVLHIFGGCIVLCLLSTSFVVAEFGEGFWSVGDCF